MGLILHLCWLLFLTSVHAQKKPSLNIHTECLGNLLQIDVAPVTGRTLEVAALHNGSLVMLTKSLALKCGITSYMDSKGTLRIYASLLNCFSKNQKDQKFTMELVLRLPPDEVHTVTETCEYGDWAPREVLCQKDYMEVSVQRVLPDDQLLPKSSLYGAKAADPRRAALKKQEELSFPFTTVRFFSESDEQRSMDVSTALSRGYSISLTHSRLVLRSLLSTPETYVQQVSGVSMTVLRTSTLFGKKWLSSQIHAAAACPLLSGSVSFSDGSIQWFLPRRIDPLLSSGQFTLLDVWFGVNGRRLDAAEVKACGYSLTVDDTYIMVEIPFGAKGGYYKSAVQDGRYVTSYIVEPMLELLWTEDVTNEDTRYRVLFPITSPPVHRPPKVTHYSEPTTSVFKLLVGPFAPDVMLLNISFPSQTLTLEKAISRGFSVQEQMDQHNSLKSFSIAVPHTDQGVQQTKDHGHTVFSVQLTFGFMVLPERQTFSVSTTLEARLMNAVPSTGPPADPPSGPSSVLPSVPLSRPATEYALVTGECDELNFHVSVHIGAQKFQVLVGKRELTPSLAKGYGFEKSGSHFTLTVPILAPDIVYEAIAPTVIQARLEVALVTPEDNKHIEDFSLSCSFFSTLTACYPNGTITVLALKLEAVPGLDPGQLTLSDPSCGPVFSTESYAFFSFTANSCGTIRKFLGRTLVYENDIALSDEQLPHRLKESMEPEYHLKVRCFYDTEGTHQLSYQTRRGGSEPPVVGVSTGTLQIQMRMAHDSSFTDFYTDENFPLTVTQQEVLWFEVELMHDQGKVTVELENCWATEDLEKNSPRWSFIHNGCKVQDSPLQVQMIPVRPDFRVSAPSLFKRFTLHLRTFLQQQERPQMFVHCDVIICDPRNPMGGVCAGRCSEPAGSTAVNVSTGPLFFS